MTRLAGFLTARLRGLGFRRASNVSTADIPHPPLLESTQPIGYKYAWPVLILLGTSSIGFLDSLLNPKSVTEQPKPGSSTKSTSNDVLGGATVDEATDVRWTMRSKWHRALLAGTYATIGFGAVMLFMSHRAHHIYRMHIIQTSKSSKSSSNQGQTLFFQTCKNRGTQGHLVPLRQCKLFESGDRSGIFLRVQGMPGYFRVGIKDAMIDGKAAEPSRIYAQLVRRGIPYHPGLATKR